MAEEWVRDAHNEARVKAHSLAEVEKSLGVLKQEQAELSDKLVTADRARLSAETGLKNMEMQAKDQRKQLHMTKIEPAT